MTKKTHLIVGTLVSIPLLTSPLGLLGICGSVFADYDLKIGKLFHRTFTHSLIFLLFTTIIINIFNKEISVIWFASYSSHLFLDSLTRSGIPLFIPIKNKRYGLKLFLTGGIFDRAIEIVGWFLLVFCIGNMIFNLLQKYILNY
jgi:inner membrane protein